MYSPLRFCMTPPKATARSVLLREAWRHRIVHLCGMTAMAFWFLLWKAMCVPLLNEGSTLVLLPFGIAVLLSVLLPLRLLSHVAGHLTKTLATAEYRVSASGVARRDAASCQLWKWSQIERIEIAPRYLNVRGTSGRLVLTIFTEHLQGATSNEIEAAFRHFIAERGAGSRRSLSVAPPDLSGSQDTASVSTARTMGVQPHQEVHSASPETTEQRTREYATPVEIAYAPESAGQKADSFATAGLIFGLVALLGGLVCFPFSVPLGVIAGVLAIISGAVGIVRTWRAKRPGAARAVGGLILGAITTTVCVASVLTVTTWAGWVLRTIGGTADVAGVAHALSMYADNHNGQFPPSLQTLVDQGYCPPQQLLDPGSGNAPPSCDFYYTTGLTRDDGLGWILAYSDPMIRKPYGGGGFVIYTDGSTELLPPGELAERVQKDDALYAAQFGIPPVRQPPATQPVTIEKP